MKAGKPSEAVLSRSVLKQLKKDPNAPVSRMKQLDYGSFAINDTQVLMSSQAVGYPAITPGRFAVYSALNNIVCGGAVPSAVSLTILFPTEAPEQELRALIKEADEACHENGIAIVGGHTEIVSGIREPMIVACAAGTVERAAMVVSSAVQPGMDLVVSKHIGLGGTAILAHLQEARLLERYSAPFLDSAKAFEQEISIRREAQIAATCHVAAMHDVSLGGIYGALWELADRNHVGLTIDLKAIPIRQETVEISEYLNVNPYKLFGAGSLLMATESAEPLIEALAAAGIEATVIGHTTDSNDRILVTGEEQRFLEMTQSDELYKFRR